MRKISLFLLLLACFAFSPQQDGRFLSYTVDPAKQQLQLYWKDDKGALLSSIQQLKTFVEARHKKLVFAMNGGMFSPDYNPVGLYIEQSKVLHRLDTNSGNGNFYLQPNGVFYITKDKKAAISTTQAFVSRSVVFATQSGPMLLINGAIHPAFKQGSANLNIRNGVGILPDGKVVFAISREPVNFYDFALYFKQLGCRNALYLDGFVSRMYLPEKDWRQVDGNFGVMIGVTE